MRKALAENAEGNVLCSIYDVDLIAEEKEKAKSKKGSRGSSKVSSRATSRPGTSGSTGTKKSSSTSVSRKPSSMAQTDKDKGDGVVGSNAPRPRSREGDGREGGAREDEPPIPGSEGLSKAALREIEAREKRQREWELEWTDRRNLAHSGMHIQESDLEMYCVTRRIVKRSYYEEPKDEDKEVDGEKPVFVSGLNWRRIDGIPAQGRRELKDKWKLEVALMSRQKFGQQEWDSFGIKDLRQDDYIQSAGKYWEPGIEVEQEKPATPLDMFIASDFSMLHGIAFAYYAHQTIWHVNAQQPNPGGNKRRPHLLFVMGSDGNVHIACVEDVPSNKLKHIDQQQGIAPYAAGENQGSDQEEKGERPESPPLWTREWVFIAKLSGAGGLDNDREMGHPRMQVCPVDSSLVAICSGLSLEIWVNQGQSVDPKKSQSLFLGGDSDSSSGEEEMDYSGLGSPMAVKAALEVHQASGKQGFSNWMLLAELREHRDLVRLRSGWGRKQAESADAEIRHAKTVRVSFRIHRKVIAFLRMCVCARTCAGAIGQSGCLATGRPPARLRRLDGPTKILGTHTNTHVRTKILGMHTNTHASTDVRCVFMKC